MAGFYLYAAFNRTTSVCSEGEKKVKVGRESVAACCCQLSSLHIQVILGLLSTLTPLSFCKGKLVQKSWKKKSFPEQLSITTHTATFIHYSFTIQSTPSVKSMLNLLELIISGSRHFGANLRHELRTPYPEDKKVDKCEGQCANGAWLYLSSEGIQRISLCQSGTNEASSLPAEAESN